MRLNMALRSLTPPDWHSLRMLGQASSRAVEQAKVRAARESAAFYLAQATQPGWSVHSARLRAGRTEVLPALPVTVRTRPSVGSALPLREAEGTAE